MNQLDKEKLDAILDTHKAQPVGNSYIDIIVSRDQYEAFINELVENGYAITSISWWEWCPGNEVNRYGLGGPRSKFYDGWFSELPIDLDDVGIVEGRKKDILNDIKNLIEKKEIQYNNEAIHFRQNDWLTPAFWLDVPDDWRNKYCV